MNDISIATKNVVLGHDFFAQWLHSPKVQLSIYF